MPKRPNLTQEPSDPDVWWGDEGIDADRWPQPYVRPKTASAADEARADDQEPA